MGDAVRPATDALRQAVFSSLAARVPGGRFLDLFAGSGAYGLEALSRGATEGVFVERHPKTADYLRRNLAAVCKSLGRDPRGLEVRVGDACLVTLAEGWVPDLVFVDPPYESIPEVAPLVFGRLRTLLSADPEALVVFEMPGEAEVAAEGWECVKQLGKGGRQPTARIFRASRAAPSPA
jgi:16S rRNA (guanine966-N2)-methyltransferase